MEKFYDDPGLNKIANLVVELMPTLAQFFRSEENLDEYSRRINTYQAPATYIERQKYLKKIIRKKVDTIFNQEERKNIDLRIDDNTGLVAGSMDHHGILNHPILTSLHALTNFYKLYHREQFGDILTFATSNVPFNDPFHKRGIILHDKKINLFPKKYGHKLMWGMPKYDFDIAGRLKEKHQWHLFDTEEQKFLEEITTGIRRIDTSGCQYLGDQMTKINFYLWKKLFSLEAREKTANLVIIEDTVFVDYLINLIKNEPQSFIYQMIFDKSFRSRALDKFEGIPGAWNDEKELGSQLFWLVDEENERVRLTVEEGSLVGEGYKITIEPEIITKLLAEKKLIPCMLLKFALVIVYLGMKTLTGFSLEYTTRMVGAIRELIKEDFPDEYELSEKIILNSMNVASITLGPDGQGGWKELYAFDVIFNGGFDEKVLEKIGRIQYKDLLIPYLAFAYSYGLNKYGRVEDAVILPYTEIELKKIFENRFNNLS
ncbi:MAG TPA: hypothetical protein PLR18_03115 [bacterium]|nr:hypothetical protein [bacterium]